MEFVADRMCFACGLDNPIGLKLQFHQEGDIYVTTFIAGQAFQGYQDIVHGGIVATLLDEVMARYVWEKYGPSATAKLEVRFRRPAPCGVPIEARGWITAERRGGKAIETAAEVRLEDGTILAEATGLVVCTK
jgi:uncharacterized protein (TIGR00369 family)